MYRSKTYFCPVDLEVLGRQPAYEQDVVLEMLNRYHGFDRISFVCRGGDSKPLRIHPQEIVHILPTSGPWQRSAEERIGRRVRPFSNILSGVLS